MRARTSSALVALALVSAFAATTSAQVVRDKDLTPTGKGFGVDTSSDKAAPAGEFAAAPLARTIRGAGINYHGGPVILGTTHTYFIWYGNWPSGSNTARDILTDLASSIGGTPYFNINTTYYNGSNVHVTNSVTFNGSTNNNYSLGKSLSDANIQSIVSSAITSGALPKDTSAVYFVLTASDVNETSG